MEPGRIAAVGLERLQRRYLVFGGRRRLRAAEETLDRLDTAGARPAVELIRLATRGLDRKAALGVHAAAFASLSASSAVPWADFAARVLAEVPPERAGPTAREAVERLARQPAAHELVKGLLAAAPATRPVLEGLLSDPAALRLAVDGEPDPRGALELAQGRLQDPLLERIARPPGRVTPDYLEARRRMLAGALAPLPPGTVDPVARRADQALEALLPETPSEARAALRVARMALGHLADGPAVRFLRELEGTLEWNDAAERLHLLRLGLRFLATQAPGPALAAVVEAEIPAFAWTIRKLGRDVFGAEAPPPADYPKEYGDISERPFGDLIRSWGQSLEGNCASVAVIKAAMQQYDTGVFEELSPTAEGGWRIRMQDGREVALTRRELAHVQRRGRFRGPRGPSRAFGEILFAAMARRAADDGFQGAFTFAAAVRRLNRAQTVTDCAALLGLAGRVRRLEVSEIPRTPAAVASSDKHAIFIRGGRSDHYGASRRFDGTDTNGGPLTYGFRFADH